MEYQSAASRHIANHLEHLLPRDRELWLSSFNYDIHLLPWAHELVSWVMRERRASMPVMPLFDDNALKTVVDHLFNLGLTTTEPEICQLHADLFEFLEAEWQRRPAALEAHKASGAAEQAAALAKT